MSVPEGASLFQALVLALWRFQGFLAGELFVNLLAAIEERLVRELRAHEPGRYRDKGYGQRQWRLPFGTVRYRLRKLKDLGSGKVFSPLREAVGIPDRVRWCEESLLPGYRLGILQSFRKSARTVARSAPTGVGPNHTTLHRRFQDFAAGHLDPVPDLSHTRGSKPTAHQQADGTKLKLQRAGHDAGSTDLRIVIGSRTPGSKLEVLDFSLGTSWEQIAARVRSKFPRPPRSLVQDGEPGIAEALAGPETVIQRCLVHGRRNLKFALYDDGFKGADQKWVKQDFATISGLRLCQKELQWLDTTNRRMLQQLLSESEKAAERLKAKLPESTYPATRSYVLGLVDQGLSYLRHLLDGGTKLPLSTNRSENIMGELALRLKRIGRRWSLEGGLNMIAAVLTSALHPERYEKIERAARGELHPQVSILINDLEVSWAS